MEIQAQGGKAQHTFPYRRTFPCTTNPFLIVSWWFDSQLVDDNGYKINMLLVVQWIDFFLFKKLFWKDWGLNSWLHSCKAGALQLEPHLQSILLWLFWSFSLMNSLPWLALNHDPPNLSPPRS
jgi:hypothetical protein